MKEDNAETAQDFTINKLKNHHQSEVKGNRKKIWLSGTDIKILLFIQAHFSKNGFFIYGNYKLH